MRTTIGECRLTPGSRCPATARRQTPISIDAPTGSGMYLRQQGAEVATCVVDVSVEVEVTRLIQLAVSTFGHLDVLVNNAGTSHFGHVTEDTAEQ